MTPIKRTENLKKVVKTDIQTIFKIKAMHIEVPAANTIKFIMNGRACDIRIEMNWPNGDLLRKKLVPISILK